MALDTETIAEAYAADRAERTRRIGRVAAPLASLVIALFAVQDFVILGFTGLWGWRLLAIAPLAAFSALSGRFLRERPLLIVPLYAASLFTVMVHGVGITWTLHVQQPDVPGFKMGTAGALVVIILGELAVAGGARRHLWWILGAPLAVLMIGLPLTVDVPASDLALLFNPVAAAVVVAASGLIHDRLQRREHHAMAVAASHKEELEQKVRELEELAARLTERTSELAARNTELQQFAHVASHDLKEPLRTIGSFLTMLRAPLSAPEPTVPPDADRYIAYCIDATRRMTALIDDLLAWSWAGTNTAAPTRVDLNEVLDVVRNDLDGAVRESHATIESGRLPVVLGDRRELTQVLENLVSNGIKYQRPGATPHVHIAARETESTVEITVADNGIGIDPRYFGRIFEVFQRLHGRGEFEGTGMGLAICRRIVDRRGGSIEVASAPGEGSTFTVRLPRGAGESKAARI